jgi:hypothetical protein
MDPDWEGRVVCSDLDEDRARQMHRQQAARLCLTLDGDEAATAATGPWPDLVLGKPLGHGVYGIVYAAQCGDQRLAVKVVPLIESDYWDDLEDSDMEEETPHELKERLEEWQHLIADVAADRINNAALAEAMLYKMAYEAGRAVGAPWFVRFDGAFRVGELDLEYDAGEAPPRRNKRAREEHACRLVKGYERVVDEFDQRVPSILICTERCRLSMKHWYEDRRESLAPGMWLELASFVAQAACAILVLKAAGIRHNDFHMSNVMLTATDREFLVVRGHDATYRVPTHGYHLQVVDYGLATAPCPAGRKRKRTNALINEESLEAIRYKKSDPNIDMRTMLIDLATFGDEVLPPRADDPLHQEMMARDPHYGAVCRAIEMYCSCTDDQPGQRPWLLGLLDDRDRLHDEVARINAADSEEEDSEEEDDVYGSLAGTMLALRRVANSARTSQRQSGVSAVRMQHLFLGPFASEPVDGEAAIVLPPIKR